jgi:nucleotide-binding universal stress UspA family protein
MRWILGLDPRPRTEGALRTARWMASGGKSRFIGVHVVPRQPRIDERDDVLDQVVAEAQVEVEKAVERVGARAAIDRLEAVPGAAVEDSLAVAADYHDADALIVGRSARAESSAIVRLGRVARRLARGLPRAVMIVPSDHQPAQRRGPVLLATDLQEDAAAASHFALQLARDLGRDLVVAYVVPRPPFPFVVSKSPTSGEEVEIRLNDWIDRHGLGGATAQRLAGDPVEAVIDHAEAMNAVCIVAGSRRLSSLERAFQSSTGTDLARFASCPVVIVPPTAIERDVGQPGRP